MRAAGAVILAIAVALLGVAVYTGVQIAKDPSAHLKGLRSSLSVSTQGPSASFAWSSQGYNVTFTDSSTDNGSTIVSWQWVFGDGTTYTGSAPPVHTYATGCPPMCTETVALNVTDRVGFRTTAVTNVTVQSSGGSSGVGRSPSLENKIPKVGGLVTELPVAVELLLILLLIGGSMARAGWRLLRREPETVQVPVKPRSLGE